MGIELARGMGFPYVIKKEKMHDEVLEQEVANIYGFVRVDMQSTWM
jgi:hypothetical protein